MKRVCNRMVLVCVFMCALAGSGWADEVHLKDGRVLDGKVVEQGLSYQVYKSSHSFITVAKDDVVRIVDTDSPLEVYEEGLSTLGEDVEGYWSLADYCQVQGLREEQEVVLLRLCRIDPDHAKARATLGFEKIHGKWYRGEDLKYMKSLHEVDGRLLDDEDYAAVIQRRIADMEKENQVEVARLRESRVDTVGGVEGSGQLPPFSALQHRQRGQRQSRVSSMSVVVEMSQKKQRHGDSFGLAMDPLRGKSYEGCCNNNAKLGRLPLQNIVNLNGGGAPMGSDGRIKSPVMLATEVPFVTITDSDSDSLGVNFDFSTDDNGIGNFNFGITGSDNKSRTNSTQSSRLTQFLGYR